MEKKPLIILIVEDSSLIKERLRCMLLELDNVKEVLEAGNYEEAFIFLSKQTTDVLLLDLNLPGKSGIDILREISRQRWELTIIVLTNQTDSRYRYLCFSLGADHFLDKTADFDKVPGIIHQLKNDH